MALENESSGLGALGEAVVFLEFFEDLPDPRQRAKVLYPLDEILLLCLLAVLAGAETITDYVLALKGNQRTLRADVDLFVAEQKAADFKDTTVSRHETVDGDHGRTETRTTTVIHDVEWLRQNHARPGLNAIVVIDSRGEIKGTVERETRLYITSLTSPAASLGTVVRSHWAVEDSLHWAEPARGDPVLQSRMGGRRRHGHGLPRDECRVRTDNVPANFTTLKHIALNFTCRAPG